MQVMGWAPAEKKVDVIVERLALLLAAKTSQTEAKPSGLQLLFGVQVAVQVHPGHGLGSRCRPMDPGRGNLQPEGYLAKRAGQAGVKVGLVAQYGLHTAPSRVVF